MYSPLNRRRWLKETALLSGGMAFLPSLLSTLKAAPALPKKTVSGNFVSSDLAAYETTPPEMKARLMFNENPFGPSEKAQKAIIDSVKMGYEYPFQDLFTLSSMIADHEGLSSKHISISNGSSPFLLAASLMYGKGTIVSGLPTYEDLLEHAEKFGTKVIRVPLTADYKFDLDAMEKTIDSTTSLVYICNPNNPTATVVDTDKLKSFCRRVSPRVPVFIDEAYIDLVPDPEGTTLMGLVKEGCNIIVARTFSKLYGLAGLRVGYVVGQPDTIAKITAYSTGMFGVSNTGVKAAIASYQDKSFMKYAFDGIQESKQFLYTTLEKQGYSYVPSSANFLVFPLRKKSEDFAREMMGNGVGVRSWHFDRKEWCRVSIGTLPQMKAFAEALAKVG